MVTNTVAETDLLIHFKYYLASW